MEHIDLSLAAIREAVVHWVGNIGQEEDLQLSDSLVDERLYDSDLLLRHLLGAFKYQNEYEFTDPVDVEFNQVNKICQGMLAKGRNQDQPGILAESESLARLLHHVQRHPKIQGGELLVAYVSDVFISEQAHDAIILLKSEVKQNFFRFDRAGGRTLMQLEAGVEIGKMNKGCIVLKPTQTEGELKVCMFDTMSSSEGAQYWTDDFLGIIPKENAFSMTKKLVAATKTYLSQADFSEAPVPVAVKAEVFNNLMAHLDGSEEVSINAFARSGFGDSDMGHDFRGFLEQNVHGDADEEFGVSAKVVKANKFAKFFVLKLDKNFHVYVHGGHDNIEQGYDEARGSKYYKIYYDKESSDK